MLGWFAPAGKLGGYVQAVWKNIPMNEVGAVLSVMLSNAWSGVGAFARFAARVAYGVIRDIVLPSMHWWQKLAAAVQLGASWLAWPVKVVTLAFTIVVGVTGLFQSGCFK